MSRLVQRLELEQPMRQRDSPLSMASAVMLHEPFKSLDRGGTQPLPLGHKPIVERPLVDVQAIEQRTPMQLSGLLERVDRRFLERRLERDHVDLASCRI